MIFTRELIRYYCDDGLTGIVSRWIGVPIGLTSIARMIEGSDDERWWLASVLRDDFPNALLANHIENIRVILIAKVKELQEPTIVPVSGCLVAANGEAAILQHSKQSLEVQVNEIILGGIHYYPERPQDELRDVLIGLSRIGLGEKPFVYAAEKILEWIKSHNKAVRRGDQ